MTENRDSEDGQKTQELTVMLEENVSLLCQKYTKLGPDEIAYIRKLTEALPFMADQNAADAFINCACEDGNSVIVAHASPQEGRSLYEGETIGLFSYPISEPAVDRTLRLGIATSYVRAISQEGSRVIQKCHPINYKGHTIGVLTYEKSPDERIEAISRADVKGPETASGSIALPELDWQWFLENAIDSAVLLIDSGGYVVYRNREAADLFKEMGYVQEVLGQHYSNLYFFRRKELGESSNEEIQIHDKYLRSRIVAVEHDDISFAVFLNDITSSKTAAKELVLKSMAVQEMHHRIKNSLQTILSLISLQKRRSDSDEVRANMQIISNRIRSIATTHQMLAQNVSGEKVSLRKVVANVAHNVIRSQTTACKIRLKESGDDFEVDSDVATAAALVVNELLQNAIEHAFPGRKQGNVSIEVIRKSASYGTICVRDDGVGISEKDPQNLGSRIVRSMVREKLRGTLDVEGTDHGTTVTVSFPIPVQSGFETDAGNDR